MNRSYRPATKRVQSVKRMPPRCFHRSEARIGSAWNLLAFIIPETNTRFIQMMIDQICKEFFDRSISRCNKNTRTGNFHFSSSFFFDQMIGVSRFRGGWLDNEWNDPSPLLDIFDPQIRFFLPPFSSQPQDSWATRNQPPPIQKGKWASGTGSE